MKKHKSYPKDIRKKILIWFSPFLRVVVWLAVIGWGVVGLLWLMGVDVSFLF
jgi:hypothetical protein